MHFRLICGFLQICSPRKFDFCAAFQQQQQQSVPHHIHKNLFRLKHISENETITNRLEIEEKEPITNVEIKNLWSCHLCNFDSDTDTGLAEHMNKGVHMGESPLMFPCKNCQFTFKDEKSSQKHMVNCHNQKQQDVPTVKAFQKLIMNKDESLVECREDDIEVTLDETPEIIQDNIEATTVTEGNTEIPETLFICSECAKSFSRSTECQEHMVTHNAKTMHPCEPFKESFETMLELEWHIETQHDVQTNLTNNCLLCEFSSESQSHLEMHIPV